MTLIPDLLWTRAWRLGEAHGHEWTLALRSVTGGHEVPPPISSDMLESIVDRWREENVPSGHGAGVGSPFVAEWVDGYWGEYTSPQGRHYSNCWHNGWDRCGASHRTGTGRCRWVIDHDGVVTISISRPGDVDVLVVTVAVDGTVQWTAPDCGVRYGVRHVEAAVYELTALGVDTSVPPAIAEAAAFADRELTALDHELTQIDHWEDRAERFE